MIITALKILGIIIAVLIIIILAISIPVYYRTTRLIQETFTKERYKYRQNPSKYKRELTEEQINKISTPKTGCCGDKHKHDNHRR